MVGCFTATAELRRVSVSFNSHPARWLLLGQAACPARSPPLAWLPPRPPAPAPPAGLRPPSRASRRAVPTCSTRSAGADRPPCQAAHPVCLGLSPIRLLGHYYLCPVSLPYSLLR